MIYLLALVSPFLQGPRVTGPDVLVDVGPAPAGRFGEDVAIDGGLMAVGSPGSSSNPMAPGTVSLFRLGATSWQLETRLEAPPGIGSAPAFGMSVDVDQGPFGEFVIVGAPGAQLTAGGVQRGAAFVYEFTGAGWTLVSTVLGDGALTAFGAAVAIDETTAVIGQTDFDGRAFSASRRPAGDWQLDGELPRPGTVFAGADFGTVVDIEKHLIVVGAPGEDSAGYDSGAAYVYRRTTPSGSSFGLEIRLEHPSAATVTYQGSDVAVDVTGFGIERVLVGSQDEKAFVWRRDIHSAWSLEALLTAFDGETGGWGKSVALDGSRLVVGAPWRIGSAPGSGVAMGFTLDSLSAGQQGWAPTAMFHPGLAIDEGVGGAVAISGPLVAVGASLFDGPSTDSGAVLSYVTVPRQGLVHCAGRENSVHSTASIAAFGSPFAMEENLGFDVTGLPPGTVGFLLTSRDRAQIPGLGGGAGDLCLGGMIARLSLYPQTADPSGNATVILDFHGLPASVQLVTGSTWSFQWWHRDGGSSPTSNTSHAVELTFL
ncbi:hypothetical protein Poly30_02840 [Planctomycetes bacterium Poly30]|uniref:FG-GAP repeat protein n=1 Tax=Saltatorellus ferox TaxID=2528018 RepID=A0A518EL64_9BACT|nr:hypothetical protein Poly30_02840 [Planctomycetes bacterium Poly30]